MSRDGITTYVLLCPACFVFFRVFCFGLSVLGLAVDSPLMARARTRTVDLLGGGLT